jgi:diaminohydroxyphosphoribosylaminopyrimidine deaminase/5-amino-6-(5-phosphoribosylamino)uracil reductase
VVDVARDLAFMERALFHAELGRGRTTPNPIVGAVVVTAGGIVVGTGAHLEAGGPHAEVEALDEAGDRAAGATLYCTLEPCCHVGRTGPCVERIEAAGVARVVAAMTDPDPRVSGAGFAHLRQHRIEVTEGVSHAAAARQLASFTTWVTERRPLVTMKSVQSLDGFVGGPGGPVRLTGPITDRFFHRQRAEIDAIAIGSSTAIADDPQLTARGAYRFRPLTRVVFDWRGRVPVDRRLFSTLSAGPVIMVVAEETQARQPERVARLTDLGVTVAPFAAHDLASVLGWLATRDVQSLLVEGGPTLHRAFLSAKLVDRVQRVIVSRRLAAGVPATADSSLLGQTRRRLGDDLLIEGDVHGTDRSRRAH